MSATTPNPLRSEPAAHPRLGGFALATFALLCLLIAVFSSLGWLAARQQEQYLRSELRLNQALLTSTQQQLEAERLIENRQLLMLREFERNSVAKP